MANEHLPAKRGFVLQARCGHAYNLHIFIEALAFIAFKKNERHKALTGKEASFSWNNTDSNS